MQGTTSYSALVEKAIRFAIQAHQGQERKAQEGVPYVVHPLHVGMLLSRHGFPEEVVAAGVLHDVVEDTVSELEDMEREFGPEVAKLVAEVSEDKRLSWALRKQHTIDSIASMSDGARAITAADKLHNLADIARMEDLVGESTWEVFKKGKERTLEYYRSVSAEFSRHFDHPLAKELDELLTRWA